METAGHYLKKFAKSFAINAVGVSFLLGAIYLIACFYGSEEELEGLRQVLWGPMPIVWIVGGIYCLIVATKDMVSKEEVD